MAAAGQHGAKPARLRLAPRGRMRPFLGRKTGARGGSRAWWAAGGGFPHRGVAGGGGSPAGSGLPVCPAPRAAARCGATWLVSGGDHGTELTSRGGLREYFCSPRLRPPLVMNWDTGHCPGRVPGGCSVSPRRDGALQDEIPLGLNDRGGRDRFIYLFETLWRNKSPCCLREAVRGEPLLWLAVGGGALAAPLPARASRGLGIWEPHGLNVWERRRRRLVWPGSFTRSCRRGFEPV